MVGSLRLGKACFDKVSPGGHRPTSIPYIGSSCFAQARSVWEAIGREYYP